MDADDSRARKASLRKFLEHLSRAGKAIGVLTSGGDAQGVCARVPGVLWAVPPCLPTREPPPGGCGTGLGPHCQHRPG
ncbi:ATP-dependent 6-phosphofructokinase, platelet type-like isoform X3 [Trachypithecus francoisi]|uniref:ATP-dependent 6-phosphofructokinase, platelet type-like isoform X3 n=1 Tax=Trachypithecus francoisi TaxID=54180 RepID=UPI00141AFF96|nr:ATP-dependent 6-phosphofructokinase, platelet type-like isoform X3 [Trachypithecus francoisi]